jgi:rhodanese-related sulfurtransferase
MLPVIHRNAVNRRWVLSCGVAMAGTLVTDGMCQAQAPKEDEFEIRRIAPADLLAHMQSGQHDQLALFDVRMPDEFAISHLSGAVRVDPDFGYERFVATYGAALRGKTVVFYCTTSARSGDLALGVRDGLMQTGAKSVLLLAGGLIAWHNGDLPLTDVSGPTRFLHPYDDVVVPHLRHPELARFKRD